MVERALNNAGELIICWFPVRGDVEMKRPMYWCGALACVAAAIPQGTHAQVLTQSTVNPGIPLGIQQSVPSSQPNALNRVISLSVSNVTLEEALKRVSAQAKVALYYSSELIPVERRVSLSAQRMTLGEALRTLLKGIPVAINAVSDSKVSIIASPAQNSGEGTLQGRVVDSATGKGLSDAAISVQGTKIVVLTNTRGEFVARNVPVGSHVLRVKLLGYASGTRTVQVGEGKSVTVEFLLRAAPTSLTSVVTTATGNKQRVEVGNSVTVLNMDEIRKTAPIMTVTDALVARVPGLTALRSSGAPGDPTRLRLRGTNSMLLNNDPIVIVDGVRMFAEQTGAQNGNLTSSAPFVSGMSNTPRVGVGDSYENTSGAVPAPSPLDRLDPNMIETIEVIKGPSASAIYGSDAANGVIVITTKKGLVGPPRWTFDVSHGTNRPPGSYPTRRLRWGKSLSNGQPQICPISDETCEGEDSVVTFNALENPLLTSIGRGSDRQYFGSVMGGVSAITYSISGSQLEQHNWMKLPEMAKRFYTKATGEPVAKWMADPLGFTRTTGTAAFTMRPDPNKTTNLMYMTTMSRSNQSRSPLENTLSKLRSMYPDTVNNVYLSPATSQLYFLLQGDGGFLPEVYNQTTSATSGQLHSVAGEWEVRRGWKVNGNAGWDEQNRNDQSFVPAGVSTDTAGAYIVGREDVTTGTLAGRTSLIIPAFRNLIRFSPVAGFDYEGTSRAGVITSAGGLMHGSKSMTGATYTASSNYSSEIRRFGIFVEPGMRFFDRWSFSPAIRWDGGSSFGSRTKVFQMPKLSFAWLVSDESWLPMPATVSALKLRTSYGHAGNPPDPTQQLRLYKEEPQWLDGKQVEIATVASYGNDQLRPERTVEWEGGFDLELFDGRVSMDLTFSRKRTRDMIAFLPVAPSVYGGEPTINRNLTVNIGRVRNTGLEFSAIVMPLQTSLVSWTLMPTYTSGQNMLERINPEALKLMPNVNGYNGASTRYVEGYPLRGLWAKPVAGFTDTNGDGVITLNEIRISDSLAYVGPGEPKSTFSLNQVVSLWGGRVTMGALASYVNGNSQVNVGLKGDRWFSRAMTDPSSPLAAQAAAVAMTLTNYPAAQVVSTLRLQSASFSVMLPKSWVSLLRMSMGSVSLQGSNLGIRTNYSGLDPNTNTLASTETYGIVDAGLQPQPRAWSVKFNFNR